jgi:hypothetical protein
MNRLTKLVSSLSLLALAAGCGNNGSDSGGSVSEEEFIDALAKSYCGTVHSQCMCDMPDDPDEETCITNESADLMSDQAEAQAAGLTYDANCAGDFVDQWDSIGCKTLSELDFGDSCAGACSIYHGDVPVDGACTSYGGFSDCASGLSCSDGICYDPCQPDGNVLGEGESCDDTNPDGGYCDYSKDLYCDYETMVCAKAPSLGEACPGYVCAAGAVCDQMTMMCVAPPGIGEPCPGYVCEAGATCDSTSMMCVAEEPFVCL